MIRRSKLKIRPAIRKSSSAPVACDGPQTNMTKIGPNKLEIQSPNVEVANPKSIALPTTGSTEVQKTYVPENSSCQETVIAEKEHSEGMNITSLQITKENSLLKVEKSTDSPLPESSSTKLTAPKSRRRKLVACPQTARKRAKVTTETNQAEKGIEKSPVKYFAQEPKIDVHLPLEEEVAEFQSEICLEVPEPISEIAITSDENPEEDISNKEYTLLTSVDSVPLITEENRSITINNIDSATTGCSSQSLQYDGISKIKSKNNKSEKPKSKIAMQRDNALSKLDQLRKSQDSDREWPNMDNNIISMSDLIYLNPPMKVGLTLGMNSTKRKQEEEIVATVPEESVIQEDTRTTNESTHSGDDPTESTNEPSALPVPQIRIAEDGSVVIDDESLVMDTQKAPDPKIQTVYEYGRDTTINQCSFLRRPYARSRWSPEETDKFFRCLCIVGAEFTLMAAMFRKRGADDLRRKYRRELKNNPARVDNALMQQHLSKWTDDMFIFKDDKEDAVTNKASAVT